MSAEIRDLIRKMSLANRLWGAPRIHGELLKLGIKVSQATVGRYMPWRPKVPSPTWRSFLHNHLTDIAAIDMFVVATATFRLLYTLIVLSLDRRRFIHFGVTEGQEFRNRVQAMGIKQVVTAPQSPWQNPYVERLIGSIRCECLDHTIIFNESHLRRVLSSYFQYHHGARTHLSLNKDCPQPRRIQPPSAGEIIAFPEVGGLHHRYERVERRSWPRQRECHNRGRPGKRVGEMQPCGRSTLDRPSRRHPEPTIGPRCWPPPALIRALVSAIKDR
jgi:hypothetical protein